MESEQLQRVIESGKDRYARTLNLQAQMDERELRQVAKDRETFLKTAVEYYIKTLQTGVGSKLSNRKLFVICQLCLFGWKGAMFEFLGLEKIRLATREK